jgi:hypothetical protein
VRGRRRAREMIDFIYNDIFEWSGGRGATDLGRHV